MTKAAIIIESGYATIAVGGNIFTTTRLNPGQYVRIDDGNQYPQLCVGASTRGPTIEYVNPDSLAYACRATLYKTRKGFNAATKRICANDADL
jgi:hypothetical protein